MLETLWFCLVALMVATYVVLDGYDLGAGIVHLFVAHSDEERRQVLIEPGPQLVAELLVLGRQGKIHGGRVPDHRVL